MIVLILLAAFALRLILLNQSLWLDEAINVNNATNLNVIDLLTKYSLGDFHPPLFHAVLKAWTIGFGNSEISVRMPSVIFGVLLVYVTYLIGRKLFDTKTGLVASTLMATSPLAVYYSQEARMYMMAAAFSALSIYFFIAILKEDRLQNWLGFIFSTSLLLYTDYLPYLLIPTYFLFIFINRRKMRRQTLNSFIPSFILIFISILPWFLLFFPSQFSGGFSVAAATPSWSHVVGSSSLKDLAVAFVKLTVGRISNDNNLTYALYFAPAGTLVVFLSLLSIFRLSRMRSIIWLLFLSPVVGAFIFSFFVPVFAYFRLTFVLTAFYLILASGIITLNWPVVNRTLLTLMLTVNIVSLMIYFANPKFQRENWKGATNYVISKSSKSTLTIFESTATLAPFDYYRGGRKVNAEGALDSFTPDENKVSEKVRNISQDKDKVFLFQYLSGITDREGIIFRTLGEEGFKNTATKDFQGVGFVYEFRR